MKRVAAAALVLFVWATPAQAFTKQGGVRTMADGTSLAYDLYEPAGSAPAGGWPGVVALHGLGGSKDDVASVAEVFVSHGYAVLAYSARGSGTSTGDVELAGPKEVSDEAALEQWFAGLPDVSDTNVGAWGISYGGGEVWNGLAAGVPYKAAEVVATWTDLYSALWPQDVARSGVVAGLVGAVAGRSPLVSANAANAIRSLDPAALRALAAPRSAYAHLPRITTPVYMFQGRIDWTFDVGQALNGFTRVAGPRKLYIGRFGHSPATFPGPDAGYVADQSVAWFDHWLKGEPNGIDTAPPLTIAAATGAGRTSFAGLPPTRALRLSLHGTGVRRTTAVLQRPLETFGTSTIQVRVRSLAHYPRLVATVLAGGTPVTHGAIVPRAGRQTIRLANYVVYVAKGSRLSVAFGPSSAPPDLSYLGFGDRGSISLGTAELALHVLSKPVTHTRGSK